MASIGMRILCVMVLALLAAPESMAAGERRSGDSHELRTDIRQRRLKKVEDLEEHRLPAQGSQQQPASGTKPKPKPQN